MLDDTQNHSPLPTPDFPRIPRDRVADTGYAVSIWVSVAFMVLFAVSAFMHLLADWMLP